MSKLCSIPDLKTNTSEAGLIIQKAKLEHLSALRRLWKHNFSQFGYDEYGFDTLFFDLHHECVVVISQGAVQGFIMFSRLGRTAEILGLAVTRAFRRQRLGASLVVHCMQHLREHRVQRVSIHTQPENSAARLLFESQGFRCRGADGCYPSGQQAIRYEWNTP